MTTYGSGSDGLTRERDITGNPGSRELTRSARSERKLKGGRTGGGNAPKAANGGMTVDSMDTGTLMTDTPGCSWNAS